MKILYAVMSVLVIMGCDHQNRPNLLLVTIDTCRADRLGCYGYDSIETPHIDRLALEGVLFEQARTSVPITLPSHVTIMTGMYPSAHGVRDNGAYVVSDSLITLAEILKGEGYLTAAFISAFPLESRFNLDQGFDHYGDKFEGERDPRAGEFDGLVLNAAERTAGQVNAEFSRWLDGSEHEPFFAWIHYFDPHEPHQVNAPYDTLYAGREYDGEIAYVDESVGRLRELLEARDLLEKTVFLITSDHGEGLGEHGEDAHGLLLYDSTLRVPLVVRCPRDMGFQERVINPVRTVDLLPTILELLEIEPQPRACGVSLVELMHGGTIPQMSQYFETFWGKLHFGWSVLLGLQSGNWRYVHGPRPELYDLTEDPKEQANLVNSHPEVADRLKGELLSGLNPEQASALSVYSTPDQETQRKLQSLGYLGSSVDMPEGEDWFAGPNPLDMMKQHQWAKKAQALGSSGQWDKAVRAYQRTMEMDPNNRDAHIGLAIALLMNNEPSAALAAAEAAAAQYPEYGEIQLILGTLMLAQHRPVEGDIAARRALDGHANPIACWTLIAQCAEAARNMDEAEHAYRQILENDPSSFIARLGLAGILTNSGELGDAQRELEGALRDNPFWAPAHYNYGVLLLGGGRKDEAGQYFREAILLNPYYSNAHYALALLLHEEGKNEEALLHLDSAAEHVDDPATLVAIRSLSSVIGREEGIDSD